MEMPQDPFSVGLEDFLPMARNARKMFEAGVVAGFTEEQAMEWMIRICSAMVVQAQTKQQ
jgi:hypothetical protein